MIDRIRAADRGGHRLSIGLALAGTTALVSGVSVFLNATAVRSVGDPVLFTTLKNGVAALILVALALALVPRPVATVAALGTRTKLGLLALGVVGGSIPFVLFFTGLASASAPAAAVIHKTMFAWVALLAVVLLRERLGLLQLGALGVLLVSQLLIQPPDGISWTSGETMIAIATGLWAVEVIIAKRVLRGVPSPIGAVARMGIGLVLLVAYLTWTGGLAKLGGLGMEQWAWVLGTGLLLSAYVATWYAALRRAPATAVTAVLTVAAPITAALQLVANGQVPATGATIGYAGTLLAGLVVAVVVLRRPAAATHEPALA
ncbi:MAG TPA: EamA family transporter [Candidatus Limnocylindria bacterium]|nr:EamA family transporter [Candidatus Limnocylindria bacterium]